MYGVMAFLENELGCRWYTPAVSIIPEKKELIFNWFEHSEKPGVRVRNDFYFEAFRSYLGSQKQDEWLHGIQAATRRCRELLGSTYFLSFNATIRVFR